MTYWLLRIHLWKQFDMGTYNCPETVNPVRGKNFALVKYIFKLLNILFKMFNIFFYCCFFLISSLFKVFFCPNQHLAGRKGFAKLVTLEKHLGNSNDAPLWCRCSCSFICITHFHTNPVALYILQMEMQLRMKMFDESDWSLHSAVFSAPQHSHGVWLSRFLPFWPMWESCRH